MNIPARHDFERAKNRRNRIVKISRNAAIWGRIGEIPAMLIGIGCVYFMFAPPYHPAEIPLGLLVLYFIVDGFLTPPHHSQTLHKRQFLIDKAESPKHYRKLVKGHIGTKDQTSSE